MASIVTAVKDLVTSIFEIIASLFSKAFGMANGLLHAFIDFFAWIFNMALHTVGDALEAVGGAGKFIASNIVVIALIAGGAYGYLKYQRRQGRTVQVGDKKLN
ncbi:uncharacterized protein N7459_003499 [Penicillium hispanicum]|uniref:uncharacterized protein n=1 Tax=Penicillium hispanicum TaxID=1080232 RepID=UPI0025422726|nr:uncharacterized protein N7459_003499 [Penicillium hispanicum]KAJ5587734.1 hypothetical protein N7459_003499 [Penicillium hispanicum]